MVEFFKARNNLIGFEDEVLVELQEKKLIEKIDKKESHNNFYRINGAENVIFMEVKESYGVIIPETIEWNGCKHNFVDTISKLKWNTYGNNKVVATSIKNLVIYRAMWSLALYGDITKMMPKYLHVHHKSYGWWNDMDATVVVCGKKHRRFHRGNGGSHQGGIYFNSVDEFVTFIKELNVAKELVKNMKM